MADDGEKRLQRGMAFTGLLLMGASAALAPHPSTWVRALPPALAVCLAFGGWQRPGPGSAVAILGAAISVVALLGSAIAVISATGLHWQATMPVALAIFVAMVRARPLLGPAREPIGRVPVGWTIACAAVTPFALVAWFLWFKPDLRTLTGNLPIDIAPWQIAFGVLAFALVTAFFEEFIWRGIFQSRLTVLLSPGEAIFVQALSFGVQHAHGFPRGVVGVVLAGTWAFGLGILRSKAGGLFASTLAHVVADTSIALIVVFLAR
jgi:uncharacterized protein